jgi:hypothetical protein
MDLPRIRLLGTALKDAEQKKVQTFALPRLSKSAVMEQIASKANPYSETVHERQVASDYFCDCMPEYQQVSDYRRFFQAVIA